MVNDPYKVLGVSQNASPEEIKSAYRRLAKQYHPDLHPNDPSASLKMNEINEAYDMVTHPEKYAKRRAEEEARRNANSYGGYYRQNTGYGNGSSYSGSSQNAGNSYNGAGGWSSYGFNFDDFFNFGGFYSNAGYGTADINPEPEAGDSTEVRRAISYFKERRYEDAMQVLMQVLHQGRNARWYYIYSVCLYGNGETSNAVDYIARACQMEPNNQKYQAVYRKFRQEGQTYYRNDVTIVNPFRRIGRVILIIIVLRFFFRLLLLFMGGGMYY